MKKFDVKKRRIASVSFVILLCMAMGFLPPLSGASVIDANAAEEKIYYASDDYTVISPADMEGRLSGESQTKSAVGKVDGVSCLRLQARFQNDGNYDPYVTFTPAGSYSADNYKYVVLVVRSEAMISTNFQMFYKTDSCLNYKEEGSGHAYYTPTDDWQILVFDFSAKSNWSGIIKSFRFDFYSRDVGTTNGKTVSIAAMLLCKSPESVYDASFEFLRDNISTPVQTLDDFGEDEVSCFEKAEGKVPGTDEDWLGKLDTSVSASNGSLIYNYKYDYTVTTRSGPNPYAGFFYHELMDKRGVAEDERLDTSDFRYTVIKYRTSGDVGSNPTFRTYFYANGNKGPTFIDSAPMNPSTHYTPSTVNDWKLLVVDMAGNGYSVGWQGRFDGMRFDWCTPASKDTTATMEISDIMFFADGDAAATFVNAFNTMYLAVPEGAGYGPYDNPIKLTDDCLMMMPGELEGKIEGSDNSVGYVASNNGLPVLRLETTKTANDPYVTFKPGSINADEYKFVTVMAKSSVPTAAALKFEYSTDGIKPGEHNRAVARYQAGGEWTLITLPFDGAESWKGLLESVKLTYLCCDPQFTGYGEGVSVDIAGIAFSKTADAFYDSAYYLMTEVFRPAQVLTDFSESDRAAFIGNIQKTEVSFGNGDLVLSGVNDYIDPWANLDYKKLMDLRGVDASGRVTTADFNTTVIRYRTSPQIEATGMVLFLYTGDHTGPFQYDGSKFFTAQTSYSPTYYDTWRSMCITMNGNSQSAGAWAGDFNGFRIDWCGNSNVGEYMEISEFFFFDDNDTAKKFTDMVNSLYQPTFEEYNDEFMTEVPTGDGYLLITPDKLSKKLTASSNSDFYLAKNDGVHVVRFEVTEAGNTPYVTYSPDGISADEYKYVTMLIKSDKSYGASFSMNYETDKSQNVSSQNVSSSYSTSTGWQFITVNLSGKDSWKGTIDYLRLGYLYNGYSISEGVTYDVAGLVFCKDENAVCDAAYYMAAQVYKPTQVLTDFSDSDANYFGGVDVTGHTAISFENGNMIFTAATQTGDADPAVASDPQRHFDYIGYASKNGIKPMTTSDFGYTVVRYRTEAISSASTTVEMFIFTGSSKSPMIRIDGTSTCHSGEAKYTNTDTWKTLVVNMAEDDGLRDNSASSKFAWNIVGETTAFNGFRLDWSNNTAVGSRMEISDFIFFASAADANLFSSAVNTVVIPVAVGDVVDPGDDWPFDDPTLGGDGSESIPEFDNSEDVDIPIETESDTDTESATETETETETETQTDTESDTGSVEESTDTDEDDNGGNVGGNTEETEPINGSGSQAPFYIVCVALVFLSVASLMSVLVIRIKSKNE